VSVLPVLFPWFFAKSCDPSFVADFSCLLFTPLFYPVNLGVTCAADWLLATSGSLRSVVVAACFFSILPLLSLFSVSYVFVFFLGFVARFFPLPVNLFPGAFPFRFCRALRRLGPISACFQVFVFSFSSVFRNTPFPVFFARPPCHGGVFSWDHSFFRFPEYPQ